MIQVIEIDGVKVNYDERQPVITTTPKEVKFINSENDDEMLERVNKAREMESQKALSRWSADERNGYINTNDIYSQNVLTPQGTIGYVTN